MMFWAWVSIFLWAILAAGIVYFVVQAVRHKPKKLSLIITGVSFILSLGALAMFNYEGPEYGGIRIERSNYELVQRATKDGKALSKLNKNATDRQSYDGEKAGKDLTKIVKSIPETYNNHNSRKMAIDGLPIFTTADMSDVYDSDHIEMLVRMSSSVISQKVTSKSDGLKGQLKVSHKIMEDSGFNDN